MTPLDSKVTEYISKSEDFAKPILEHWRKLIHVICPQVEEAIKWGIPHFNYKGDFMCVMASYKKHCSFTFIKAELMSDPRLKGGKNQKSINRFLGKVSDILELPPEQEFQAMLKEAMALNEKGIKSERPKWDKPKTIEVPDYFAKELEAIPKAKEIFESKSPSFRKNYLVWITGAKTEATRQQRIEQSLEWIAEGKDRFWQYKK